MKTITLEDLENFICKEFKITPEQLKGKCRRTEYVYPRQLFCYLMKLYSPRQSYVSIGRFINRDHSTVITSIEKVNDILDTDRAFRKAMTNLKFRVEFMLNPPLEYYPYAS